MTRSRLVPLLLFPILAGCQTLPLGSLPAGTSGLGGLPAAPAQAPAAPTPGTSGLGSLQAPSRVASDFDGRWRLSAMQGSQGTLAGSMSIVISNGTIDSVDGLRADPLGSSGLAGQALTSTVSTQSSDGVQRWQFVLYLQFDDTFNGTLNSLPIIGVRG